MRFMDELVRIPDYLAGALADFSGNDGTVSKDKFNIVLTSYMAENTHNNFIYRLWTQDSKIACARVTVHKKKMHMKIILDELSDMIPEINHNDPVYHYTSADGPFRFHSKVSLNMFARK